MWPYRCSGNTIRSRAVASIEIYELYHLQSGPKEKAAPRLSQAAVVGGPIVWTPAGQVVRCCFNGQTGSLGIKERHWIQYARQRGTWGMDARMADALEVEALGEVDVGVAPDPMRLAAMSIRFPASRGLYGS